MPPSWFPTIRSPVTLTLPPVWLKLPLPSWPTTMRPMVYTEFQWPLPPPSSIQVLVQFGLVAVFVLLFQVPLTAKFLLAPLIVGVLLLFVVGAGLLCSALNVIFRDTHYIVESLLTVLFWLSPVFYPLTIVHEKFPRWLFGLYILNPLAGCIEGLRRVVLQDRYPDGASFAVATLVSLATLVLGAALFTRLQRRFADLV